MESKSVEDSSILSLYKTQPHRTQRSFSTVQIPETSSDVLTSPFFIYKTSDFYYDLRHCTQKRYDDGFKNKLLDKWYAAKKQKVFNYDLNCIYKLLDGTYDLSFQLNVERGTLRRKPMRFQNIRQPFNHLRFNFTKLKKTEHLYHLRCLDRPYTDDKLDVHALAVNASPLEKGHSLIIPSINKCLPQILNSTGIRIAVDLMLLVEDENFHILFNSLLGQASVNHLHMHTLFWPYKSGIVTRKCESLCKNIFVLRRSNWFIQAIVFQLKSSAEFDDFISDIAHCVMYLTNQNIAHNLFMSRAPPISLLDSDNDEESISSSAEKPQFVTAYMFPRRNQTGAKPPTNFNPAAAELAGFLTAYTYRFFESATEQTALRVIDEDAVLSEYLFESLADGLAKRYLGEVPWEEEGVASEDTSGLLATGYRRHSQCLSENGSYNNDLTVGSISELSVQDVESLSSHELDELTDTFHSVTSPLPTFNAASGILHSPKKKVYVNSIPLAALFNREEQKSEKQSGSTANN